MFNTRTFFSSISSFWSESTFTDSGVLQSLFETIAAHVANAYSGLMELPGNLTLESMPVSSARNMLSVRLLSSNSLTIDISDSEFVTIFGLDVQSDFLIESVPRLYITPDIENSEFLVSGRDYWLCDLSSPTIEAFRSRVRRPTFFSKFDSYLVVRNFTPSAFSGSSNITTTRSVPLYLVAEVVGLTSSQPQIPTNQPIQIARQDIIDSVELDAAEYSDGRWLIQLPVEEYIVDGFGLSNVSIIISGKRYPLKFIDPVMVGIDEYSLTAFRASVNTGMLYRTFGHIISDQLAAVSGSFVRDSENLRESLIAVRNAKLSECDTINLDRLLSTLSGLSLLKSSTLLEPIFVIDSIHGRLHTQFRRYSLSEGYPLNETVVRSIKSLPISLNTAVSTSDLKFVTIMVQDAFLLLSEGDSPIPPVSEAPRFVYNLAGDLLFTIRAVCSRSLLVSPAPGSSFQPDSTAYTVSRRGNRVHFSLVSGYQEFETGDAVSSEPIQLSCRTRDLSAGDDWWVYSEVSIPEVLWPNGARRNNITSATWLPRVGLLPQHRVGDYGFRVTDSDEPIHSTAWNIFSDIYSRNTAVVSTSQHIRTPLFGLVDFARSIVPLGTNLLVDSSIGFTEVISSANESITATALLPVEFSTDHTYAVGTGAGVGELNVVVTVELSTTLLVLDNLQLVFNSVPGVFYSVTDTSVDSISTPNVASFEIEIETKPVNYIQATSVVIYMGGIQSSGSLSIIQIDNAVGSASNCSVLGSVFPILPFRAINFVDPATVTDTLTIEVLS